MILNSFIIDTIKRLFQRVMLLSVHCGYNRSSASFTIISNNSDITLFCSE